MYLFWARDRATRQLGAAPNTHAAAGSKKLTLAKPRSNRLFFAFSRVRFSLAKAGTTPYDSRGGR